MQRCMQLAQLAAGNVAPNPMVGAVLVHDNKIIGEGYHQQYGAAHAEVNCFNSVSPANQHLIKASTLYVSLEPCNHFGKTPPCADLIIQHRVPEVVIGSSDPFAAVDGKGIAKLRAAGIIVTENILQPAVFDLNKRFFTFHTKKRPWVLLKWAQTADGFIAAENYKRLAISNAYTNRYTHQLRATEAAILVGSKTALLDDPMLNSRYGFSNHPVRIIIDKSLQLPATAAVFANTAPVIVINCVTEKQEGHIHFAKVQEGVSLLSFLMKLLYNKKLLSLIVEGGAYTLQSFIDAGLWDEALVINNKTLFQNKGIPAPSLHHQQLTNECKIDSDLLSTYKNSLA